MSDPLPSVRGRGGPRPPRENEYPRKSQCGCVDKRGEPATPFAGQDGSCVRCGHPIKESR
jgi:hypothetical protein